MIKKFSSIVKSLFAVTLVFTLVFGNVSSALAARGGRIGGGSFRRAPSSVSPRGGGVSSPGIGGGGIGFPFLLPFFWGGGSGGIFSILIFIAIANFLVRTLRNNSGEGGENGMATEGYGTVSVAKVQVGLLASARYLQQDLNDLALSADTSTPEGRVDVLQESSLSLLRHPEYWVYGTAEAEQAALSSAEAKFNQWSLNERGKLTSETLTNVNNQIRQAPTPNVLTAEGGQLSEVLMESGEYILVTILVGIEGKLQFPKINDSQDLKQALQQIGSIGTDRLLAMEVIWTPQAEGDVLTSEDILTNYPDLKLV